MIINLYLLFWKKKLLDYVACNNVTVLFTRELYGHLTVNDSICNLAIHPE